MASGDRVGYQGGPQYGDFKQSSHVQYFLPPPGSAAGPAREFQINESNSQTPSLGGQGYDSIPPPPPYQNLSSPGAYSPHQEYTSSQTSLSRSPAWNQSPTSLSKYFSQSHVSSAAPSFHFFPPTSLPEIAQPIAQRPVLPHHQFTQPQISVQHDHSQQPLSTTKTQYEQPYTSLSPQSSQSLVPPPYIPPRPSSAPPGTLEDWQSSTPGQPVLQIPLSPAPSAYVPPAAVAGLEHADDHKSHGAKRFVGNMLVVRLGRSTMQSLSSTAKLPFYLSPWGDNNPITLPNVRKRDIALAGFAHAGIDALAPSAVSLVDHAVQYAATWTTEAAADHGIHAAQGAKAHKVTRSIGLNSFELRIKHKLIGEDAELTFLDERESIDKTACGKGWFCPYLYASGRTCSIARGKDFSWAQLIRPGLAADASIAPTLLSSFTETSTPLVNLCPWESPHPTFPRFRRMAIFLVGISPYRTATAWSQSRIPNEARLSFHLGTHVPAIVVPVGERTPVVAWNEWTLEAMLDAHTGKPSHYDSSKHFSELMRFAETVLDESLLDEGEREGWRTMVGEGFQAMIDAELLNEKAVRESCKGSCELDRMGVVAFRF